ncbi:MAG: adenylate/guanylate cyclase domain-containing protein [Treponema sp.]|uniref:adenylate/guanylate cyclase domain-containing protein n=1 Tax=Treponema sp. TaxID=166 RepID=UPI00298E6AEE|nr:adenylate/guanylate cyclase domain-containing protein [Treponema sp.]MCQ2600205.1 adenylate/guanylate cyclase domain-containing protein [Treponema sp.]
MQKKVKTESSSTERFRVKYAIGFKLAVIMGVMVVCALGGLTFLVNYIVSQNNRVTAEDNNLTLNTRSASAAENELTTIRSNVFQLLDLVNVIGSGRSSAVYRQAQSFFFERNSHIGAILLMDKDINFESPYNLRMVNNTFFLSNEIEVSKLNDFITQNKEVIQRSCAGETIALNASPLFETTLMAMFYPWAESGQDQTCIILFSIENLTDSLALGTKSINSTFMVNDAGDLLLHSDTDLVKSGASYANYPLVENMRENNDQDRQIVFKDNDGVEYFGAYHKISMADIGVLTIVETKKVYEAINRTTQDNLLLSIAILCASILFILIYTHFALSKPLKVLKKAVEEITHGNFNNEYIDILDLVRKDEIGVLNKGTKDEQQFLNTFGKFTNQNVAKAIATKSIDFEPHLKDLTIFFSDIRGFTAISDGFKNRFGDDSAANIIGFLNDYMSRMVNCVTLSHGNIDKFEGDAIMGLWGIMRDDDLSFEHLPDSDPKKAELARIHKEHVMEDAVNCVRGIIAMRYALMKYNKDAEAFTKLHANEPKALYKPHIRIGCGINTGRATAGIMGSDDKMEYTAIGDAVNFASRTEASNKPCGTDILITEDTYNLLKNDYIRTAENNYQIPEKYAEDEIIVEMIPVSFDVKGKGEQHFYGVVNMPKFDIEKFFRGSDPDFVVDPDCEIAIGPKGPKTMNEVRTLLGIDIPDFEKVNLNEEENKIQIKQ